MKRGQRGVQTEPHPLSKTVASSIIYQQKRKTKGQNKWVGPRKRKWEIESTERGSQREEAILWRKVVPFLWHTQQEHPERLAEPWLCIPISYLSQLFGAKKVSAKNNKKKKKKKKKRIWKRKKGCMWRLGKHKHGKKLKQPLTLFEMK